MTTLEISLHAAFRSTESTYSGIKQREVIPDHLRSPRATRGQSTYGSGIGRAAALVLSGDIQLAVNGTTIVIDYQSSDRTGASGTKRIASIEAAGQRRWLGKGIESGTGPWLLALVEALVFGSMFETSRAFHELFHCAGGVFPVSSSTLRDLPVQSSAFKEALMRFSDATYFELKSFIEGGAIVAGNDRDAIPVLPWGDVGQLLGLKTATRTTVHVESKGSLLAGLKRLSRRGGAALLVGPPGTFKTESGKRLALETGAHLVVMKGAPGVEDRDFIGGIYPGPNGPEWVDGPLTQAFALANEAPTVLLVDEVLRYHAENLNILVGAMDLVSRDEAIAIGVPAEHVPEDTRYHLLNLPNGQVVTCPKRNLTWVMTTNVGDDHVQTSAQFDAALLSRFAKEIDVPYADPEVVLPIYRKVARNDDALVSAAYDLELFVREQVSDADGLFVRSLDARKVIALLEEAVACVEDGMTRRDAFKEALLVTAVPYCCPRDAKGKLDEAAKSDLIRHVERHLLPQL